MAKKSSKGKGGSQPLLPSLDFPEATARPLPINARPLFLPRFLKEAAAHTQMAAYADDRARARGEFLKWIENLKAGVLHGMSETQVEQDFTSKLLAALGYRSAADVPPGQPWSMTPKWAIPGAGIADAALGTFRQGEAGTIGEPLVVVELKGAGADLDRHSSTRRSPVQQAWDYLNASDSARWAIVSNYVEIRLYSRQKTTNHVHRAILTELADPDAFAEFFAVFHADSLLSRTALQRNAFRLLEETEDRQEAVSRELYDSYAEQRAALIQEIEAQGIGREDALRAAQTLLDRILFIAFAEDRGLLDDRRTIETTCERVSIGLTRWNAFQLLFRAIDRGDAMHRVPAYNGSLFKRDPILDDPDFALDDDRWPTFFKTIAGYDFRYEVTVDVLGHIFEQSIKDIEEIRAVGLDQHEAALAERRRPGRRKREGVFYTNAHITAYLVAAALDPAWQQDRAEAAARHGVGQDIPNEPSPAHAAYLRDLLARLDALTVCDPACGSGAFLIAAFEWFEERRLGLLADLKLAEPDAPECTGEPDRWRAESAPKILQNNLFGVDLSPESVEIARLSLWIRTARKGQKLTDLSDNVLDGNSVVDDPAVDPRAFDWSAHFPAVRARGGFDAVVGNPPYVRQEWLGPIKPHLEKSFSAYHGMADLYVYFYERGLRILRPGGRLAFVVTNKWMKAGYGEPLRRLFAEGAWVESVVDFGHARQFFPDADVFPCFLVARKPADGPPPESARVCVIPRDLVQLAELPAQVAERSLAVERDRFGPDSWQLEPRAVADLLAKIRARGVPLAEFAGVKPFYGIKTGLNEAFLIDTPTRDALIEEDPKSAEIIKPYLRGQDIKRWSPAWAGLWMIFTRRGIDIDTYPAIKRHLDRYRKRLEPKPEGWSGQDWPGRKPGPYKWFEIQDPVEYWSYFEEPKIVYQEIQFHPVYGLDETGYYSNNKAFFIPTGDLYLLGVLNSPVIWWHNWRFLPHMKDEALSPSGFLMEALPIARPSDEARAEVDRASRRLIEIAEHRRSTRATLLDWLRMEYEINEPGTKLGNPIRLTSDVFVSEVRKRRGKKGLSAAALKALRDEYARTIEPARELAREARALEARIGELVNAAYGLTPEEVHLLWDTAPPRMPTDRPGPTP